MTREQLEARLRVADKIYQSEVRTVEAVRIQLEAALARRLDASKRIDILKAALLKLEKVEA